MDQGTVLAIVDVRNSWLAVELGSTLMPVDLCLGQDVVNIDADLTDENKGVVFIIAA